MLQVKSLVRVGVSLTLALVISALSIMPVSAAAVCGTATAPSSVAAKTVTSQAYQGWKQAYLVNAGNNQLRIQRSAGDNYDTVSEGIAYGMLFAAYSNDKNTFDGLWRYAQAHTNNNGFMNWRIAADGSTTGYNGATDADEDMAAALIAADTQWGGYTTDAKKMVGLIKKYEVEAGSNVLKPGDAWGGSNLLNPSYLTPSYYTLFAQYTNDSSWNDVKAASYRVFNAISTKTDSRQTGYIPDWSAADGSRASGMGYEYGYDGSRAPLRLAMAGAWDCDTTASGLLDKLNATNQNLNLGSLASSYNLDGSIANAGDGTPLLAAAATAATVSDNTDYRLKSWNSLVAATDKGYFSDSMRLFGLFIASGTMVSPLQLKATAPETTPSVVAPTTFSMSGSNASGVPGGTVTVTASVIAPRTTGGTLIDLEVYDASGNRVAQKFVENQTISTNPTTYSVSFTPTSTGTYTVRGGIFTSNWAANLTWNNAITTVTVASAPVPVVTPPAAPVVTPTPVPTPTPVVVVTPTPAPVVVVPPAPTTPIVVLPPTPTPIAAANVSIWWPSNGSSVRGVQPFKVVLDDASLSGYTMYWQVDGGTLNKMGDSTVDAPHKESLVDLTGWSWRSDNKYTINFVAQNADGTVIAQKSTTITVYR